MKIRQKARIDANQKEIVKALETKGAYVESFGPVDLLIGYKGLWFVLEVKDGNKTPSQRRLTKHEIGWILDLKNKAEVHIVKSIEEAFCVVGIVM